MLSKIADIESLYDIKDNSIVAISGFNMAITPEYLIIELYNKYVKQGHPKNIFIMSDALPAVPGRGLDHIAEKL
jgi:propionate CoA-transferase